MYIFHITFLPCILVLYADRLFAVCHINVFYYIERIFFCLVALFFYFYNFFCYHASIITITYYLNILLSWSTINIVIYFCK